jgi:transcriptional regulator with XRE-family HTH domain
MGETRTSRWFTFILEARTRSNVSVPAAASSAGMQEVDWRRFETVKVPVRRTVIAMCKAVGAGVNDGLRAAGYLNDQDNMSLDERRFKERLRGRLRELGMVQADLADALGKNASTIRNWCNGSTMPRIFDLPRLAVVLDCSIAYLLGQDLDAPSETQPILTPDQRLYLEEMVDILTPRVAAELRQQSL